MAFSSWTAVDLCDSPRSPSSGQFFACRCCCLLYLVSLCRPQASVFICLAPLFPSHSVFAPASAEASSSLAIQSPLLGPSCRLLLNPLHEFQVPDRVVPSSCGYMCAYFKDSNSKNSSYFHVSLFSFNG